MTSLVSRSRSLRPRGILRCVERCCPSAAQTRRSETCNCPRTCSMQARRRAGLRSFPWQPQLRSACRALDQHHSAEPAVLELKVLQALDLLGLQPAKLLPPPIIGHLAHPDLTDRVGQALALRYQHIDLSQLGNDFLRLVAPPRHIGPP